MTITDLTARQRADDETRQGLRDALATDAADTLAGLDRDGWLHLTDHPTLAAFVRAWFAEGLGRADESDAAEDWAEASR